MSDPRRAQPEAWLRGPVAGVPPPLIPVAHALIQASEDLEVVLDLSPAELSLQPGGAASIGFHLRHLIGSMDRLLTYARGEALTPVQLRYLSEEKGSTVPFPPADALVTEARNLIETTLRALQDLTEVQLMSPREVGRAKLPSTTLGVLFHLGEHTTRHVGQIITTRKIIRGLGLVHET